ncbi:(2Fe-2S)-binding protein [Algoriphagus sp. PAP.12]|uniref:(2Fe-2S)-binding protein n=1 Tax=Algoriphagus sp. PAP.12 TaxID=2996678 RepID=UPI00227AAB76|nr:(2Fe-2S)-binding protein [Algoriphagus sp. PAP.12]
MPQYSININGEQKSIDAPEDMPILWVIRDLLGMKGTKFGCGKALCGACTVHLDGQAIRSCSMPVSALGIGKITTIEGLSDEGNHPVQKAWVEHIVPQCGYCQSGQIMNAASLLNQNPNPSDEEIEQAMSGNLCRCGTYNRIKEAIKTASNS